MSAIQQTLLGYGGGAILRPQDVFSAYPYTGNGSTQTINNGIDLAGKGGLVWTKGRSATFNNMLLDTSRNITKAVFTDATVAEVTAATAITAFNSDGYTLGVGGLTNATGQSHVSWTFRKAPKFFDVVTYTGDGASSRNLAHTLAARAGRYLIKRTDSTSDWGCASRISDAAYSEMALNTVAVGADSGSVTYGDESNFKVGDSHWGKGGGMNILGASYVAYLTAHDPSTSGIVLCHSFVTNGSGVGTYNHGWAEGVQYVELKCHTATGDWEIFDTARTPGWSGNDARLRANLSNAEDSVARISSSGTTLTFSGLSARQTYIFTMIRAPI